MCVRCVEHFALVLAKVFENDVIVALLGVQKNPHDSFSHIVNSMSLPIHIHIHHHNPLSPFPIRSNPFPSSIHCTSKVLALWHDCRHHYGATAGVISHGDKIVDVVAFVANTTEDAGIDTVVISIVVIVVAVVKAISIEVSIEVSIVAVGVVKDVVGNQTRKTVIKSRNRVLESIQRNAIGVGCVVVAVYVVGVADIVVVVGVVVSSASQPRCSHVTRYEILQESWDEFVQQIAHCSAFLSCEAATILGFQSHSNRFSTTYDRATCKQMINQDLSILDKNKRQSKHKTIDILEKENRE